MWTRLDNVIVIGVFNGNCAVDVGTVGKMVDLNGGMTSKHRV